MTSTRPIVVMDFDGVICDSTEECVVAAWNAWVRGGREDFVAWPDEELPGAILQWAARPALNFVRTAGEYLVLLDSRTGDGQPIGGEAEYDQRVAGRLDQVQAFAPLLFAARQHLRSATRRTWLNLHTIYPGVPGGAAPVVGVGRRRTW